jgi:hypothetical protein
MSGLSLLKSDNYNEPPKQGGNRSVAKKDFDALGLS